MNLKSHIARFSSENTNSLRFTYADRPFEIFRTPVNPSDETVKYHYYIVDKAALLGEGTSGNVYAAFPLDENYHPIQRKMAVKIFSDKKLYSENEAKILSRYCFCENPIEEKDRVVLIMEDLGEQLITEDDTLHPIIKKLTFLQRIDLISQILLKLNLLHHNTSSTGNAVVHCDLKGSNILIKDVDGQLDVAICDFGYSFEVEDDSSLRFSIKKSPSSPGYIPPELINRQRGLKSDIYSLLPTFLMILGATKPFSKKQELEVEVKNIKNKKDNRYDFAGLFSRYQLSPAENLVKPIIIKFLNRMHQTAYHLRPDSDELLSFFITLGNYCRLCESSNDQSTKFVYLAKLLLLAEDSWYYCLGSIDVLHYIDGKVCPGKVTMPKTFADYDFDNHPVISEVFVVLSRTHKFKHEDLIQLFKRDNVNLAQILMTLHQKHLLSSDTLKHIVHNYSDKQIDAFNLLIEKNLLSLINYKNLNEDFAAVVLKLNSFSALNATHLTLFINLDCICKKYGLNFNVDTSQKIISSAGISVTEALKVVLKSYQQNRRDDKRGEYFHFWSKLTGFDAKTKCKAIDEFINVLDNKVARLSEKSKKVLNDGRIKLILNEFRKYDTMSPDINETMSPSSSILCF